MAYEIRALTESDLAQAMALVRRVFAEFEAPDYSEEGIEEFHRYIEVDVMRGRMAEGLRLWGCFDGGAVIGVIAMRPPAHISLLFVDRDHHRRGVARGLWDAAKADYRDADTATVNSSPYAREAYRRLGFRETGPEQCVNGLRFIPMRCDFEGAE